MQDHWHKNFTHVQVILSVLYKKVYYPPIYLSHLLTSEIFEPLTILRHPRATYYPPTSSSHLLSPTTSGHLYYLTSPGNLASSGHFNSSVSPYSLTSLGHFNVLGSLRILRHPRATSIPLTHSGVCGRSKRISSAWCNEDDWVV